MEIILTQATQPPTSGLRLLCLSNGHGEDIIAVRILQELQQHSTLLKIAALPLVGEGRAYTQVGIPLIGSVQTMPSGGFIYMDGRQLARDLRGGLLQLTLSQLRAVRSWVCSQGEPGNEGGAILAVGDIVPLLFAWLSGATYAFVGTAKSEYYVRDEAGRLPRRSQLSRLENWSGSVYHPWERWLMSRPRCKAVFPRDSLTTETLQKWSTFSRRFIPDRALTSIPAFDLGNPMMDQLEPRTPTQLFSSSDTELEQARSLTITLLPGSRAPEAYANWQQILVAVAGLLETFPNRALLFLLAIAPGLSLEPLRQSLASAGFQEVSQPSPILDPDALTFTNKNAFLVLSQHAYNDCLDLADLAIAMAGTATEQFVGLGKPAIAIPGIGPQFTYAFAEAQSRLLGPSLILVQHPTQVADVVQSLLSDPERLQLIADNGVRRMGKPGAARRIADCLMERLGH